MPDSNEGELSQQGHDRTSESEVEPGIAKHGGHVHGDRPEEPFHRGPVAEEPPLEFRDRLHPFRMNNALDAACYRRVRIVPEIKPIRGENRLQEQLNFEGLDIGLVRSQGHGRRAA